jgi:hypothetical protein
VRFTTRSPEPEVHVGVSDVEGGVQIHVSGGDRQQTIGVLRDGALHLYNLNQNAAEALGLSTRDDGAIRVVWPNS